MNEIQKQIEDYFDWIRANTHVQNVEGGSWVQISTPFLDVFNDPIQVYVRRLGNEYEFSDDGAAINNLTFMGCSLDSERRQKLLKFTLSGYGVQLVENVLTSKAGESDFPIKQNNMVQAIQAVNDLFCLSKPHTESIFLEDVTTWLKESDVRVVANHGIVGKSGLTQTFNFVIPSSSSEPERLVDISNVSKSDFYKILIYKWLDVVKQENGSQFYTIYNDTEKKITENAKMALGKYDITPIPWSDRNNYLERLKA